MNTCVRLMAVMLLFLVGNVQAFQDGTILLGPNHGGDGSAWGQTRCAGCHLLNFIHDGLSIRQIARRKGFENCFGCHGSNGTNTARPCAVCHNSHDLPTSPILSGAEKHNFVVGESSRLTDQQCLACHEASDMNSIFDPAVDLSNFPDRLGRKPDYEHIYQFCLRCHNLNHQQPGFEIPDKDYRDPLVAMENNYRFIDMHGERKGSGERTYTGLVPDYQYATVVECTDCHAMHGTHNKKIIIDESRKGVTRLHDSKNYSIDVFQGDYSQLCVTCHRMDQIVEDGALDTGNGLSGVHMTGTDDDCTDCHTHGQAAQTGL